MLIALEYVAKKDEANLLRKGSPGFSRSAMMKKLRWMKKRTK